MERSCIYGCGIIVTLEPFRNGNRDGLSLSERSQDSSTFRH